MTTFTDWERQAGLAKGAADTIASLERELAEARESIAYWQQLGALWRDKNDDAEARERVLREALTQIVEEKCDYMRINLLGDPETQHTVKLARTALSPEPAAREERACPYGYGPAEECCQNCPGYGAPAALSQPAAPRESGHPPMPAALESYFATAARIEASLSPEPAAPRESEI